MLNHNFPIHKTPLKCTIIHLWTPAWAAKLHVTCMNIKYEVQVGCIITSMRYKYEVNIKNGRPPGLPNYMYDILLRIGTSMNVNEIVTSLADLASDHCGATTVRAIHTNIKMYAAIRNMQQTIGNRQYALGCGQ